MSEEQNDTKLKELILYICEKSKDDPNFDMDKLNWLLYNIDFEAYKKFGKSITGSVYIRMPDSQPDPKRGTENGRTKS